MTDDTPYTRRVAYTFTIKEEDWEVIDFSVAHIYFEETRKNGQEDCHMSGEAVLSDGKWELDEQTRDCIETYAGPETADATEAFFNEHGPPAVTQP